TARRPVAGKRRDIAKATAPAQGVERDRETARVPLVTQCPLRASVVIRTRVQRGCARREAIRLTAMAERQRRAGHAAQPAQPPDAARAGLHDAATGFGMAFQRGAGAPSVARTGADDEIAV